MQLSATQQETQDVLLLRFLHISRSFMPSLALYGKRDSDCHPVEGGPNYACTDHFPQENLVPRTKCFEEFDPGGPFSWGDQHRRDRPQAILLHLRTLHAHKLLV